MWNQLRAIYGRLLLVIGPYVQQFNFSDFENLLYRSAAACRDVGRVSDAAPDGVTRAARRDAGIDSGSVVNRCARRDVLRTPWCASSTVALRRSVRGSGGGRVPPKPCVRRAGRRSAAGGR